jgi:hypothetical protein
MTWHLEPIWILFARRLLACRRRARTNRTTPSREQTLYPTRFRRRVHLGSECAPETAAGRVDEPGRPAGAELEPTESVNLL